MNTNMMIRQSTKKNSAGESVLDFIILDPTSRYPFETTLPSEEVIYEEIPNRIVSIRLNNNVDTQIEVHSATEATFHVMISVNPKTGGNTSISPSIFTDLTINIANNQFKVNGVVIGEFINELADDVQIDAMTFSTHTINNQYANSGRRSWIHVHRYFC